jgi:formate C-acetyltransferase
MMLEITYGIGHFTMDHVKVLSKGLRGTIDEARKKIEALPSSKDAREKKIFYEAVIRSCNAAIMFARRYSALANAMAEKEKDPVRAEELRGIARVCGRVPEHPAETFHEAVQSMYFIHLIAQIESGGNSISLGRIDQVLYPYYRADRDAGRITPERRVSSWRSSSSKRMNLERARGGVYPGGEERRGRLRRTSRSAGSNRRQ